MQLMSSLKDNKYDIKKEGELILNLCGQNHKERRVFYGKMAEEVFRLSPHIKTLHEQMPERNNADLVLDVPFEQILLLYDYVAGKNIDPRRLNPLRKIIDIKIPLVEKYIEISSTDLKKYFINYRSSYDLFCEETASIRGERMYDYAATLSMMAYYDNLEYIDSIGTKSNDIGSFFEDARKHIFKSITNEMPWPDFMIGDLPEKCIVRGKTIEYLPYKKMYTMTHLLKSYLSYDINLL
jgi:hypothetical protein